jgi:UDP-N-acetylmuramoyl-L-alanyl-D-glutamate--2,6-diaminopimelate ligase
VPTPAEPSGRGRPNTVAGQPVEALAKLVHARERNWPPVTVRGVTLDSRAIRQDDLYAALPGSRAHGAEFAGEALRHGALAVLTDRDGARLVAAERPETVVLEVEDARAVLGDVAAAVYGHPAERLVTLGVTGTNGKTTTTYLLDAALRGCGQVTGLLGTVETRVAEERWASTRTTPESPDVQALLARMVEESVTACSMEVSSHALSLHRVDGVVFDVAGFTNLSQDHLDFHHTMEDYFEAKAALFTPEHARAGVICVDGPWGVRLAARATVPVETLRTVPADPADGGSAGASSEPDWQVEDVLPDGAGSRFVLTHRDGRRVAARSPLPGAFNVANAALALLMLFTVAQRLGLPEPGPVEALGRAGQVPGRMQAVDTEGSPAPGEPLVLVDYAHTPAAVTAALQALNGSPRPLVVVLGAGGDRDSDKRGPMGAAAAALADVVVVTDDNPRSEPPEAIRAAVLAGARKAAGSSTVIEVTRRRAAIAEAIRRAWGPQSDAPGGPGQTPRGGGTVLLAGKGHEQGQEVAGVVHPFDDRTVAGEVLRAARHTGPRPAGTPHDSSTEESST